MAEWKASGLTAAEFAAGRGYAAATLKWWSSRLNTGAVDGALRLPDSGAAGAMPLARLVVHREGESRVAPSVESPVVVVLGHHRLELRRGFDPETLRGVLGLLEAGLEVWR